MIDWRSFCTIVAAIIVAELILDGYRRILGKLAESQS